MDHPVLKEAAVATPPAGYLAAYLAGIDLPHLINVCMAIYAAGLAVKTIWAGAKFVRRWGWEWWRNWRAHRTYRKARRKIRKAERDARK